MAPHAPAWIGLAGPTAGGKSALALALADRLAQRGQALEIVSVDSALVYRGMDIGTAKPSAAERAAVPHHLIDLLDPAEAYSAARFVQDANTCIAAIRARGALPLLVGGTMLYFKALIDGLDAMPAADPSLRAELASRARREGWPALHAELARVDAATAARLPPTDAQRIQRALEVFLGSGVPMSQWHARGAEAGRARAAPHCLLSLEATHREGLHQRIAERFDAMLAAGLVDEVRALRARGDLHAGLPSMRCVGYRQAWAMLDGQWPAAELPARGSAATRQLAKRQMTWLRSLPQRTVLQAGEGGLVDRALAAIDGFEARLREGGSARREGPT